VFTIKCFPRDEQRDAWVVAKRFSSFVELRESFSADASIQRLPFPSVLLSVTGWVWGGGGGGGTVSRPFPSWNRSVLTEIYLCHACSCQEISVFILESVHTD
jgi:hypothetical protein